MQALDAIGGQCNCVALTRKGGHFYFNGAVPDLHSKQFDSVDVRTGGPPSLCDIIIFEGLSLLNAFLAQHSG